MIPVSRSTAQTSIQPVDVPVWSREEGRSDLTLQRALVERPDGGYRVEIDDLHVL